MTTYVILVFAGWSLAPGGDTRRRVRVALEWLRHAPRHRGQWYVVCLGGRFNQETKHTAAATRMRAWMCAEHLIPSSHIFAETRSRDTVENLSEAFALLDREGIHHAQAKLVVVSHPWHAERIQSLLKHRYHRSAQLVPAWHPLTWKERFTEGILVFYHLLDPRGEGSILRWIRERRTRIVRSRSYSRRIVKESGIDD